MTDVQRISRLSRRSFTETGLRVGLGLPAGGGLSGWLAGTAWHLLSRGVRSSSAAAVPSRNHALMIGVTRYQHAEMNRKPLSFPEKDAEAVGDLLKASGYEVTKLLGRAATRSAILSELAKLNTRGDTDGVVIVGLFGHGVEMKFEVVVEGKRKVLEEGCFCPWDTGVVQAKDEQGRLLFDGDSPQIEPLRESLIRMREVMTSLKLASAGSRVVFADCCREMPNRARGRNLGLGARFQAQSLPNNSAVLFGCSAGELAFERDDWGHGAFTKCLLEQLRSLSSQGEVTTGTLGDRVKREVRKLTGGAKPQTPQPFQTDSIDLQLQPSVLAPVPGSVLENSIGTKLVLIPAGEFLMGSPESDTSADSDERPQHRVRLSRPYYLGKYEVTQREWKAVMGTEPWKGKEYVREGDDYPAAYISHEDAEAFCRRLSALPAEKAAGRVYRLPTEAEWEHGCRGGNRQATKYHFGDSDADLDKYAWYDKNALDIGEKYAHRVGQKLANGYGLHDTHGNVAEWCSDWYASDYYASAAASGSDPAGPPEGSARVLRGGCFAFPAVLCRPALRYWLAPSIRDNILGFRLALSFVGVPG